MKLRFMIRDLLWLASVVALLAAIWLQIKDNQRLTNRLGKEKIASQNRDQELQLLKDQLTVTRDQLSGMAEQLSDLRNSTQK